MPTIDPLFAAVIGGMCSALGIAYTFGALALLAGFLWSAVLFMISAGDEERVSQAKRVLVGTIVAAIVLYAATGIPPVIADAFGTTLPPVCK